MIDVIHQLLLVANGSFSGALGEPSQEYLLYARQLQAMSFIIHIPLVCFGIAFPAMVVFMEWLGLRTGNPVYRAIAKRWSKIMIVFFAVGVVTGTILSFELGLLWPNFMATFGEVFGLAFGLEGFAFFLEAIFIAIYVYGWDRIAPKKHILLGLPIVVTGLFGSLTVISVNAWMNQPGGFEIVDGVVTNVQPWTALLNSHTAYQLLHMYLAGFMVAGFLVAGIYAFNWLKGNRTAYIRAALIVPLTFAALVAPIQVLVGDWAAREVANTQPIKLAAMEGLGETTRGAPFTLGGIYDAEENRVKYGIEIPKLLSVLAFHDPNAEVLGLETVPAEDRPPVNIVRISFQLMVGIGTGLLLLAAVYLVTWLRRRSLPKHRLFYWAVVASGPAAVVALLTGWFTTEVGRQPWIVNGVMRTEDAVTAASGAGMPIAFYSMLAVYLGLIAAVVWLLRRLSGQPLVIEPFPGETDSGSDEGGK